LGHREALVRRIVWIGTATALAGVYIYFAQVQGWWEPGRSRLGTDGGEQTTLFAYAFHRAMGTFREPSHFAEWLVIPFFLSFAHKGRGKNLHTAAMAAALLLTGSLTGILAIASGLAGALALGNPFRGGRLKVPLRLALAAGAGLVLFNAVAVTRAGETADLLKVLTSRIEPILEGGVGQSNRYYVYDYVASQPIPIVGAGLGHAQMQFSLEHGSTVITSFLSLYLNALFSVGVPGLAMLLLLLAFPVVGLARQRRYRTHPELMPLMAAYLGWLVMYVVHSEELSLVFGVLFALVAWESTAQAQAEDAAA
jgi:O-antigen ligase